MSVRGEGIPTRMRRLADDIQRVADDDRETSWCSDYAQELRSLAAEVEKAAAVLAGPVLTAVEDPNFQLPWAEDQRAEEVRQTLAIVQPEADEDPDPNRCTASSWRAKAPKKPRDLYAAKYGPGGYNRCRYTVEPHEIHEDEFGNVFVTEPKFRVIRKAAR